MNIISNYFINEYIENIEKIACGILDNNDR